MSLSLKKLGYGAAAIAVIAAYAGAAQAQSDQTAQTLQSVPNLPQGTAPGGTTPGRASASDYDPIGMRAGGFLIFPKLELGETYNSNIFATKDNAKDDFITVLSPSVNVKSDWNRHALNLRGSADIGRYASHTGEDYEDYGFGADGRLDILHDLTADLAASADWGHEDRSSPDNVNGKHPTPVQKDSASGGVKYKPNLVSLGLSGSLDHYDYDDVQSSTGANINNDDRDRNETRENVRVGYDIKRDYEAYLRGTLVQVDYNAALDDSGVNRDSAGYEMVGGVGLNLTDLIVGDVFGGYMSRSYDDARLKDISGVTAGAGITWSITQLTNLRLTATRDVEETTALGSSGYVSSAVGVSVTHELRRNIIIGANLSYDNDDYSGVSRTDNTYGGGVDLTYKLNRNFYTGLGLSYKTKDSNINSNDYDQAKALIKVGAQF